MCVVPNPGKCVHGFVSPQKLILAGRLGDNPRALNVARNFYLCNWLPEVSEVEEKGIGSSQEWPQLKLRGASKKAEHMLQRACRSSSLRPPAPG
jgi:hypothetical protein